MRDRRAVASPAPGFYGAFIRVPALPYGALTDRHTILLTDANDLSAARPRSAPWGRRRRSLASPRQETEIPMMDVIYLALGVVLFAALAAYAYGCERL